MRRSSLERFKGKNLVVELSQIDPWELTFSDPGETDIVLRVSDMPGPATLCRALLGAFYEECGNVLRPTRKKYVTFLMHFAEFLSQHNVNDSLDSLNDELLKEYRNYVTDCKTRSTAGRWKNDTLAKSTQRQCYKLIERLVVTAGRLHGRTVHYAPNPFPRSYNSDKAKPNLSPVALIRILFAAKREAREAWSVFESGKYLDDSTPLGIAVRLAIKQHGGIWPKKTTDAGKSEQMLYIVRRAGGTEAVSRRLHITTETIIPFLILLAYETVANPWALIDFPEDCVNPDPLFDTRSLISWNTKRRSKFSQSVSRDHRGEFSAPVLIEKLKQMKERLVPHANALHRHRLFLTWSSKIGIVPLSKKNAWDGVQAFIKRNDIREEDGSPVKFTLDMMRPSVLAEVYRRTQDLLVAFQLAGHADFRTTIRYVIDRATDEMHDSAIAEVQGKLADAVRDIEKEPVESGSGSKSTKPWPGNERDCKDPSNGRGPFARKGHVCPTWFFPYTHSGLVVPNEVRYVANVIRQRRQIEAMQEIWSEGRFEMICAPVLRIIREEIIPHVEAKIVEEATVVANALPPLPVFSDL